MTREVTTYFTATDIIGGIAIAIIIRQTGAGATDGVARVQLKGRGLQVAEMPCSELGNAVTNRTGIVFPSCMLVMLAREIAIVLVRIPGAVFMAGPTLRVDIQRTVGPGRRGLATVTTGIGAGAAVEAR